MTATALARADSGLLRGRKVLVTGGAGFIGSHLVDALLGAGARVAVLDSFVTGRAANLAAHRGVSRLRVVRGDVRSSGLASRLCRGADTVFHLAAQASVPESFRLPEVTMEVNVGATATLMEECSRRSVRAVVFASSSSVYGGAGPFPQRETNGLASMSPYAASKICGESLLSAAAARHGLGGVSLRMFNVYGPRQQAGSDGAVVPSFLGRAARGTPLLIHGSGRQTRDFVHVGDAVRAMLLAAVAAPADAPPLNVSTGTAVTISRLAEIVRAECGLRARARHGPPREGDVRRSVGDPSAARRRLGWRPEVPLDEGLHGTIVSWMPARGAAGHRPPAAPGATRR